MISQRISLSSFPFFSAITELKLKVDQVEILGDPNALQLLHTLPEKGIGIIGSRTPQKRSLELLENTLSDLAHTDLIVISGFANGIDTHAHEHAIKNGLRTIALLGCGIKTEYPKENQRLKREIVETGGLVISQFESTALPYAGHFPQRNSLIATFSKALWIVEAGEFSGTLNTANWGSKISRDLYATSSFPDDPFFQGNQKLLSTRDTHRYPIAHPFFSSHSFLHTWPYLLFPDAGENKKKMKKQTYTQLEQWVLEIKYDLGVCPVQTLMNHARQHGQTLGEFYKKFEKEIQSGNLIQLGDGSVDIPSRNR